MNHSFNVDVAKEVGVNAAILLENIYFWVRKNEVSGEHIHDGKAWTHTTRKVWAELFPYMTENQIQTATRKLKDSGLVEVDHHSENPFDRGNWYTVTDKTIEFYGALDGCLNHNEIDDQANTRPMINHQSTIISINNKDIDKDIERERKRSTPQKRFTPPDVQDVKAYCLERGNNVDPEQFVNFYESNGWKVGKNKMKDWKAAVRTWEKRDNRAGRNEQQYQVADDWLKGVF